MKSVSTQLKELATAIGWTLVNDDKGFSTYEYEIIVSKYEHLSHVIRILDSPNELEIYEILITLTKVLPFKLRIKLNKLINKFKLEDFSNMVEVLIFTIEEYKTKTDYAKLKEYAGLIGVDIEKLGYAFEYKMRKKKKTEVIAVIEYNMPMEITPALGKIKKIEYKIAYVKNMHNLKKRTE